MPWDNHKEKEKIISDAKNIYAYESPFPDYDELEKNPSVVEKFSFKGQDKLNLGIDKMDYKELENIFFEYICEWNPSNNEETLKYTKNPKFNFSFPEFDAFVLYCFIRYYKPNNIIEIGSGQSTRIMVDAILKNNNNCQLICIEPYNDSIIALKEKYPLTIIKDKVEMVDINLFNILGKNDILFIDSSHVLRPFGDIEYEYLHILPILKDECIVHIHDIFYPYDYPINWIMDWKCTLTEQQFLLALLYGNNKYKLFCANNYLVCNKNDIIPNKIEFKCGGSFWIVKSNNL